MRDVLLHFTVGITCGFIAIGAIRIGNAANKKITKIRTEYRTKKELREAAAKEAAETTPNQPSGMDVFYEYGKKVLNTEEPVT